MTGVRDITAGLTELRDWATDPRPRVGWGLPFFDARTNGGIARSEICMVQAFSYVGKTALLNNIIHNNAGVATLFFSLEMSWRNIVLRQAAIELGTTTVELEHRIREAAALPPEMQRVADKHRQLVCDDTPSISLKDALVSFERAADLLGEPPRLVAFDYLELIGGGGLMEAAQAVDKLSRKVRDFARTTDSSVIVLHQVGKGEGGDQPGGLDSGRYGGFAPMDYVVHAYAPKLERGIDQRRYDQVKEEVYLQLLKNRTGPAHPVGVRHRLDSRTLRLTPWSEVPLHPLYQQEFSS